jgi:YD repeat-containing protein
VTETNVDELATLEYNYDKGNLKRIIRAASGESQEYTLEYDDFGNSKSIKVGNRTLATYEYLAGNGPLTSQTYGNGLSATYGYDILGRTKTVTYSDGLTLTYTYTGDGQLYSITAVEDEDETKYLYNYDSLGRLIYSERKDNGSTVLRARQGYDGAGRPVTHSTANGPGPNISTPPPTTPAGSNPAPTV